MEFYYKAIQEDGARVTGFVNAGTQRSARADLMKRYASVLLIEEAKGQKRSRRAFKIKPENVVVFYRRLATMVVSGVSWADALEFMVKSESSDELAEAADHLAKLVQRGQSLSNAMRDPRFKKMFDSVSIGMVAMGEQTGQLNRVIGKLADLKERQLGLTRAFVSALTYPAVLLCVIIALGVLFTMILGPGDSGLFAAFGTEMPWPTKVVQKVSYVAGEPAILLAIAAVIGLSVWLFLRKLATDKYFRLRFHSFVLALPAIGPLVKKIECARILYVISDGLHVGVPIGTALIMSRDVCGNEKIKREISKVHKDFSEGVDFSEALALHDIFPPIVLCMVETGMESGKLDAVLGQASKNFEEDVRLALDAVSQLAEPLLLIFAGVMAGFLALATLMPIIQMVDTLG